MGEKVEVIKDRLYWTCIRTAPVESKDSHFFCTDDTLTYDPYYSDFGPLNTACVCRYCRLLTAKLNDPSLANKVIFHCCRQSADTRANSVFLICTWLQLCQGKTPEEAFRPFLGLRPGLMPYRDASLGPSTFQLTVPHCLAGLERAVHFGWFDLDTFDPDEYEHYERVENGDFNWIVPGFFLSFSGPTQTPIAYVDGVKTNTPETYFDYYRKNGITGIIRFNNKVYDRKKFLDAGFNHYDMYTLPTARLGPAPNPTAHARYPPLQVLCRRRQPDRCDHQAVHRGVRERARSGRRARRPLQGGARADGDAAVALPDEALWDDDA